MRVSPSYTGAVHRHEEAARRPACSGAFGDGREYAGKFVRYPIRRETHRLLSESLSVCGGGDVVEDGRVKDDEGSVLWSFVAKPHEVAPAQVALQHPWPDRGSDLYGPARRLASRAVCSGQTSVSSHATCEESEASIGLRSNPARQTTCGGIVGNGVVSRALCRHYRGRFRLVPLGPNALARFTDRENNSAMRWSMVATASMPRAPQAMVSATARSHATSLRS